MINSFYKQGAALRLQFLILRLIPIQEIYFPITAPLEHPVYRHTDNVGLSLTPSEFPGIAGGSDGAGEIGRFDAINRMLR